MSQRRMVVDSALPGLAAALDPQAMRDALRSTLPEARDTVQIENVAVADVRYDPGQGAELLYRVKVRELETKKSSRVLLVGVLGKGEPPAPPAELLERYHAEPRPLRTPQLWLPDLQLTLRAFPLDAELPMLADALDPRRVRDALSALWRRRDVRLRDVHVEALGYTPHNRAAFYYETLAEDRHSGIPEMRRIIAKMHGKKTAERLFAGSWALWRAVSSQCRLAPPLGYLPTLGVTLQEQVRGERLGALASDPTFTRRMRQTARALVALHDASVPLATRRKPDEEARVVHRWSHVLRAIRPDLAEHVGRLRDQLAAALEQHVQLKGAVHADFHHTNVLVADEGITIIDLDEMAYGDPLLDVGRFLASLRIPSLRTFGNLDGLAEAREQFLEEYLRHKHEDVRRVRLFEAACLFTAAASSFRIQRQDWYEEVGLLIEEAGTVFRSARHRTAAAAQRTRDPAPFPVVERSRVWARDPVYMRTVLGDAIAANYGDKPDSFAVRKHEDHELARYQLKGKENGTRWSVVLAALPVPTGSAAVARRIELLRAALAEHPEAPYFPRPLCYVRQLGVLIVEAPRGEKLSRLLLTAQAGSSVERFARALATLHRTTVLLDKSRAWTDELKHLERRVRQIEAIRPDLFKQALELVQEVSRRTASLPMAVAPALNTVRPRDILVHEERVIFARVDDPLLGTSVADVADFCARVTLAGLRTETPRTGEVKDRFRAAYQAAGGMDLDKADAIEAAALLRLACTQAEKNRDQQVPVQLLRAAHALL